MDSIADVVRRSELLRGIHEQHTKEVAMEERNPLFDPTPNETYNIRLVKHFLDKNSKNGKPFSGFEVLVEGKPHTWFVWQPGTAQELKSYAENTDITVKLTFEGKTPVLDVRPAVVAQDGGKALGGPKPPVTVESIGNDGAIMAKCISEAGAIVLAHNQWVTDPENGAGEGLYLNREDIVKIGLSLYIAAKK